MGFDVENVTWEGPRCDDLDLLGKLPEVLRLVVEREPSGFIQFRGGLHYRGACSEPGWHSLRAAWLGPRALYKSFPAMTRDDVPFAQDYLGNQYILRNELVMRLMGETGEVGPPIPGLAMIGTSVQTDPPALPLQVFMQAIQGFEGALDRDLLDRFLDSGQALAPGELIHVYPPMCSLEAEKGIRLTARAMKARARLDFLASVAKAVRDAGPGRRPSFPLVR